MPLGRRFRLEANMAAKKTGKTQSAECREVAAERDRLLIQLLTLSVKRAGGA
jgi:hypothetical protein